MTKDGSFFLCLHMVYDTQTTIVDGIYKPIYPLVMTNIAIENGPVEIVDLPMDSMMDLSSSLCSNLPEGISH